MTQEAQQPSSEWHVIKETRDSKLAGGKIVSHDHVSLRRDDGLVIDRTGLGRPEEMTEFFTCKGSFGEFKFTASRWNSLKAEPLDTYTVNLYDYIDARELRLAKSHARDIESALLNYPIHPFHKNMPVKDVVFHTGDVKRPVTSHAEEII